MANLRPDQLTKSGIYWAKKGADPWRIVVVEIDRDEPDLSRVHAMGWMDCETEALSYFDWYVGPLEKPE